MAKPNKKEFLLVLGGARSGKSSWALKYAEDHYSSCLFLATAEVIDEEMALRVRLHKESRGPKWRLIEEPINIIEALETRCSDTEVVLIDCVTIWLSNILLKKGAGEVAGYEDRLLEKLSARKRSIIIVSNEVGGGIVPANRSARQFRDLAGLLNQKLARLADNVVVTTAGIPIFIK